ncbi:MAG TPA: sigma-70 family RNA polymerase sigma factor [Puia sp.]|jgi:RNA polymerase sigma-70 factor (ECF subfamily)
MENSQWLSILEGDKEAFLAFYREHYQRLYSYCFSLCGNKELTKDCIQELFLELWKSRHTVNPEVRNELSYLMTWLRRILSRQMILIAKKNSYTPDSASPENEPSYEELLIRHQDDEGKKRKLHSALLQLTPNQLNIIKQRFFEKKSFQEIAEENGLARQTVYNVVYKALIILKQAFEEFTLIFLPLVLPVSIMITPQFSIT